MAPLSNCSLRVFYKPHPVKFRDALEPLVVTNLSDCGKDVRAELSQGSGDAPWDSPPLGHLALWITRQLGIHRHEEVALPMSRARLLGSCEYQRSYGGLFQHVE